MSIPSKQYRKSELQIKNRYYNEHYYWSNNSRNISIDYKY